ncbi:MAG: tRNA (cytidine(34)-2'-O)-methyltransferase [Alphaproteobacteria bacterium]|nr:MAG: tRNA (cytidine(34)-2'-O)-methyltransferase [Alphaproteobacteria bacterium]|tara:strand:- start:383 stop:847 length:465 start_codon:yes stop_codon:yes gene_type:complete
MFHIILYNPEIPPNTGNIMRLAANTGTQLHLIRPLGFNLSNNSLKRAGLDYKKDADFFLHDSFDLCLNSIKFNEIYAFTKFAKKTFTKIKFKRNDCFLFGSETSGLPDNILDKIKVTNKLRIPMIMNSRSLNLSNSVAITVYEGLRQNKFENLV